MWKSKFRIQNLYLEPPESWGTLRDLRNGQMCFFFPKLQKHCFWFYKHVSEFQLKCQRNMCWCWSLKVCTEWMCWDWAKLCWKSESVFIEFTGRIEARFVFLVHLSTGRLFSVPASLLSSSESMLYDVEREWPKPNGVKKAKKEIIQHLYLSPCSSCKNGLKGRNDGLYQIFSPQCTP